MPLNFKEKEQVVANIKAHLPKIKTMVLAEYCGITVSSLTQLRVKAREKNVHLQVLKNTLAKRALADSPFAHLAPMMRGPLIYSMSEDEVAAAQLLFEFSKQENKIILKGGSCQGQLLAEEAVKALAAIPSREVLIARLLGAIRAPYAKLARALAEIAKQRQQEATSGETETETHGEAEAQ